MAETEIKQILKLDVNSAINSLELYKKKIDELRTSMVNVEKNSKEWERLNNELLIEQRKLYDELHRNRRTVDDAVMGYDNMVRKMTDLKREWRAAGDEVKRTDIGNEINKVGNELKKLDGNLGSSGVNVGKYADAFKNALGDVSQGISAISPELGVILSTIRTILSTVGGSSKVFENLKGIGGNIKIEGNGGGDKLTDELKKQNTLIKEQGKSYNSLIGVASGYEKSVKGVSDRIKDISKNFGSFVESVKNADSDSGKIAKGLVNDIDAAKESIKELRVEGVSLKDFNKELKNLGITLDENEKKFIEDAFASDKLSVGFKKAGNAAKALGKTLAVSLGLTAVIALIGKAISMLTNWIQKQKELKEHMAELRKEMDKVKHAGEDDILVFNSLSNAWKGLTDEQKKNAVDEFAKSLSELGIAAKTVADIDEVLINNTDNFKKSMLARAKYASAYSKIQDLQAEKFDLRAQITGIKETYKGVKAQRKTKPLLDRIFEIDDDLNKYAELLEQYAKELTRQPMLKGEGGGPKSSVKIPNIDEEVDFGDPFAEMDENFKEWQKNLDRYFEILSQLGGERVRIIKEANEKLKDVMKVAPWDTDTLKAINDEKQRLLDSLDMKATEDMLKKIDSEYDPRIKALAVLGKRSLNKNKDRDSQIFELQKERFDRELELLGRRQKMYDEDSEMYRRYAEKIEQINLEKDQNNKLYHENQRKRIANEIQLYAQAAQSIGQILGTVADIEESRIQRMVDSGEISEEQAKKMFEDNKAWQYSSTWINTLAGMTAALTSPVMQSLGVAGWIASGVQAANILASGIASTIQIQNTEFGSASVSGGGSSKQYVPVTPTLDTTRDLNMINEVAGMGEIADNIKDQRVYILESDIQDSNKRVKVRENESTFV